MKYATVTAAGPLMASDMQQDDEVLVVWVLNLTVRWSREGGRVE